MEATATDSRCVSLKSLLCKQVMSDGPARQTTAIILAAQYQDRS